ncbi:MAG TPA: thioredoxin family protein [Dehalococcoidia bacterium]|nr:thioredoxin family protein [Dehalococcoidia bacterium]
MVTKQQVISPERFASALSYDGFIAQAEKNLDEFKDNYENTKVSAAQQQRLQAVVAKPNGPKKLLVLGEDWCPDVYRGLPVLARLAEAAGIEFKALPRDKNLDIMNAYLNKGEFQSIPCAIFLTDNLDQVLVWHERPEKANREISQMRDIVGDRSREEAAGDLLKFRRGPVWASWRDATIDEITEKLEAATK